MTDQTIENTLLILFIMLIITGIVSFFKIRKIQKRRKIGFKIYEERKRIADHKAKLLKVTNLN